MKNAFSVALKGDKTGIHSFVQSLQRTHPFNIHFDTWTGETCYLLRGKFVYDIEEEEIHKRIRSTDTVKVCNLQTAINLCC